MLCAVASALDNKTPWQQWRGHGLVTLSWSPADFWAATPHDLLAALDALHGNASHGLTQDILEQLHELRSKHEL